MNRIFQIYFSFFLFWEIIVEGSFEIMGISINGSIMRQILVVIFMISVGLYAFSGYKTQSERKVWITLCFVAIAYYLTQFFYEYQDYHDYYIGQLLRWGSDCVPACFLGLMLAKQKDYSLIHKVIPLLCVCLTPAIAYFTLTNRFSQVYMTSESGLNYQNVSYYSSIIFAFTMYYSFLSKYRPKLILRYTMKAMLVVQCLSCLMSGGRGGFVLMGIYGAYFLYQMVRNKICSLSSVILIFIFLLVTIIYFIGSLGLEQTVGLARVFSIFGGGENDRTALWVEYVPIFWGSPIIGHGLGSNYFTWGFYSHNFIIDFLVELGFFGTIVMILIYVKTYKRIKILQGYDEIFSLVMIYFIYGLVYNTFSGYWISTNAIWLSFGVAANYRFFLNSQNSTLLR